MADWSETVKSALHPEGKHAKTVMVAGVVLGVFIIFFIIRRRSSGSASTLSADTTTPADAVNSSALAGGGPVQVGNSNAPAATDSGPDLTTNVGWESAAVHWLSSQGVSGVDAQSAVETYLQGGTLTYPQYGFLNGVIKELGVAPQGTYAPPTYTPPPTTPSTPTTPATPTTPTTPSKPKPASKPKHSSKPVSHSQTYVVKRGDNLSSIAARYGTSWQAIYNANRGAIGNNPNLIYSGTVLKIH